MAVGTTALPVIKWLHRIKRFAVRAPPARIRRRRAILGEDIAPAYVLSPFAPSQRRTVKSDVANQIEGVQVFADFFGQGIERQAFVGQFFDDGLLSFRPALS